MTSRASENEIERALAGLEGWKREGEALVKTFRCASFREAVAFVGRAAELAEAAQHHPDILIRYRRVTLTLSTHDAGGITEKDLALARRIEAQAAAGPRSAPVTGSGRCG